MGGEGGSEGMVVLRVEKERRKADSGLLERRESKRKTESVRRRNRAGGWGDRKVGDRKKGVALSRGLCEEDAVSKRGRESKRRRAGRTARWGSRRRWKRLTFGSSVIAAASKTRHGADIDSKLVSSVEERCLVAKGVEKGRVYAGGGEGRE